MQYFDVSNMTAAQIKFIRSAFPDPLVVNQLEMSLARLNWLEQGVLVNQKKGAHINFADDIMEHCQIENIQFQAWRPLTQGIISGRKTDTMTPVEITTAALVQQMAHEKDTIAEAIVLGWLMKHPVLINL